jgi:hypothetical protein
MIPDEIEALAQFLEQTPSIAAEVYANSVAGRARPIVDNHFTHGGQQQYGFAPLSPTYAREKAGQTKTLRKGMKSAGFVVSKAQGGQLPILVRTGSLRSMVSGMKHAVSQSGDAATVTFSGLPDYAEYLDKGTPRMPARSPVRPGPLDLEQINDELRRRLSVILGIGERFGQVMGRIPAMVRVV